MKKYLENMNPLCNFAPTQVKNVSCKRYNFIKIGFKELAGIRVKVPYILPFALCIGSWLVSVTCLFFIFLVSLAMTQAKKKEAQPVAQKPEFSLVEFHTDELHKVITDFFRMNEPATIAEHLTDTLTEYVSKPDEDSKLNQAYWSVTQLYEVTFTHSKVITFMVRLQSAWESYQKWVLGGKEVGHD